MSEKVQYRIALTLMAIFIIAAIIFIANDDTPPRPWVNNDDDCNEALWIALKNPAFMCD